MYCAEYMEYSIVIRTSVAMNIVIYWIKNGKRHAPDELADGLEKLMKKMITLDQLLLSFLPISGKVGSEMGILTG